MRNSYDAVIIGAGHNGLTLGAYLARSGLEVLVVERRHEEGGGLCTEELTLPGFLHNVHANYHTFVDLAPPVNDLGPLRDQLMADELTFVQQQQLLAELRRTQAMDASGKFADRASEITVIVAVVASTAISRVPGSHDSAIPCPTRANTGTSASTARGVNLAATILRCARHRSPSELRSPRPMVGARMRFTSRGFS